MQVVVLGGGWSGVSFALEFKKKYPSSDIIVLDKGPLGGLLRSVNMNGYIFDIGGSHVIFSRDKEVLDRILSLVGTYVSNERKAYVKFKDKFIPYPFENGIFLLSPEERSEILINFLEKMMNRDPNWRPKNLLEWIREFFGDWLAKNYLEPYNYKVWKRPLDKIDVDWVYTPGRLPIPDWRDIVKSAVGIQTIGYKELHTFYYPAYGGIETQYRAILKKAIEVGVKVIDNVEVRSVKKVNDEWVINEYYKAGMLVNSIPLPELITFMDAPEEILKTSMELDYNMVATVGIGLNKEAPKQHWVYVPDSNIVFHRYVWASNYSPNNAPKGRSSLLVEVTIPKGENVNKDQIKWKVIDNLIKLDIIKEKEISFYEIWIHKYGYPVHTIVSNNHRNVVLRWLKDQNNVISIGRWGLWQYWNTDRIYRNNLDIINSYSPDISQR